MISWNLVQGPSCSQTSWTRRWECVLYCFCSSVWDLKPFQVQLFEEREEDENGRKNSITSFIACSTRILILNLVDLTVSSIFFRFPCCKRDQVRKRLSMVPGSRLTMRWEAEAKPQEAEKQNGKWVFGGSIVYFPFIYTAVKFAKPNK